MLFLKVLNANFLHCQVGLIISDIACRWKFYLLRKILVARSKVPKINATTF